MRAFVAMLILLAAACTAPPPSGMDKTKAGAQADSPLVAPPSQVQTLNDPVPNAPQQQSAGEPMPEAPPASQGPVVDVAACKAQGGEVQRVCLMGHQMCVTPYPDAGKTCRSSDECAGQCMGDGSVEMNKPTTGKCQATNQPCGCMQFIENGVAQPTLCAD